MTFTDELRKNANAILEANYNHPFVQGIGKGTLPKDKFIFFLKQDYVYLIDFARYLSLVAIRQRDLGLMTGFIDIAHLTLTGEMELHRSICADFGITTAELEKTRPAPDCLDYTSYLIKSALLGSTGDILCGFLPCGWGYVEIGQRLKKQGLPVEKHYSQWIETYASDDYDKLIKHYRTIVDEYARTAPENELHSMQETFDFSSRLEYMFWEMAWNKKDWPI